MPRTTRAATRAASKVIVLCLLGVLSIAGCGQRIAGIPSAAGSPGSSSAPSPSSANPAPSSVPESRLPQDAVDLASLEGRWRGEYDCSQGRTGMELEISAPEGDTVPAVFRFFPLPERPQVPSGSFTMRGRNTETGLVFEHEAWIEQPQNYVMVDLGVASVEGDTMVGRVAGSGCGDFSVQRQ